MRPLPFTLLGSIVSYRGPGVCNVLDPEICLLGNLSDLNHAQSHLIRCLTNQIDALRDERPHLSGKHNFH